jgi:8-amino-7-oxononanoate synthase
MVQRLDTWLDQAAQQREAGSRVRRRRPLKPVDAVQVHDGDRVLVNFSGNDYLGLSGHPEVAAAAVNTLQSGTCGAGASALVTGYRPEHQALEARLAQFLERESVVLFSSGFLANLAVASSLTARRDTIVQDRLCHASLIDGARLSGARLLRYAHLDTAAAGRQLSRAGEGNALLVTDGVFSMDGDVAPLADLARACGQAGAWMVVDDAHGFGVTGPGGRGVVASAGLSQEEIPVLVGTLGKACGSAGAFVAGSRALVEHLVNEARSYIYTTAMPPAVAAAGLAGLERVIADDWRREKLCELTGLFREGAAAMGWRLLPSQTPIQPLLTETSERALRLAEALRARGFLVVAIRPPTVPEGGARLRVTFSAAHKTGHVEKLLEALEECRDNP